MVRQSYVEDWPDAGVALDVPGQVSKVKVRKVRLALPALKDVPGTAAFRPGRLVINFELVDDDRPEVVLKKFDPPFELRVRYTRADWKRAEAAKQALTLAYWDGKTWVPFTPKKHGFELQPDRDEDPSTGGVGYARISDWDDPAVGWGP
jgi:hypothetical protein